MVDQLTPGPGEQRARQRQRRQIVFVGFAAIVGGLIGFFVGFFDQGDGNLFNGDWEALSLHPAIAIAIAAALIGSLLVLPLWGFRMIDDFNREHNFIAFTGSSLAVLTGFPVWAALYAGGFVPPPHAFGIWVIGFVSMFVAYTYARWLA